MKDFLGIVACFIISVTASFATPPVHFIENKNQWPDNIDFLSRISGGAMFLTPGTF